MDNPPPPPSDSSGGTANDDAHQPASASVPPPASAPAEDEEDNVVTFKEYVEDLEAQELEVDLILGGDEGKECTYPKGYVGRQAVFSCITCCPDGNAGVCTACSMTCHDGHEVVELWTRRHFRCDCGNSKFGTGICKLFTSKDPENSENVYNQNFTGVYCTCKRPYPDPECSEDQGEMLQCCICEDWFHEVHLGLGSVEEIPRDEEGEPLFDELICQSCVMSLPFLSSYSDLWVVAPRPGNMGRKASQDNTTACSTTSPGEASLVRDTTCAVDTGNFQNNQVKQFENGCCSNTCTEKAVDQRSLDNGNVTVVPQTNIESAVCKLKLKEEIASRTKDSVNNGVAFTSSTNNVTLTTALFMGKNWRSHLCQCADCLVMYSNKDVSFLTDLNDTLSKYEESAKQKRKEKMEANDGRDMSFLNGLSHVGQIEFLHGLNDMTNELSAFFASCEAGKTITSADIYEFFENLKRKRARLR